MRYGNKTAVSGQVSKWLNNQDKPTFPINFVQSSLGVAVVSDVTPHVKGAWTEIVASTSSAASLVVINIGAVGVNNVNTSALLDLGIGASGSETKLVENLAIGYITNQSVYYPIQVPAGSRLSMRTQSAQISRSITFSVILYDIPYGGFENSDTYGIDLSTSQGTVAGKNVFSLIGTASRPYGAVVAYPSVGGDVTNNITIGFGPSTSDVQEILKFSTRVDSSERTFLDDAVNKPSTPGFVTLSYASVPVGANFYAKQSNTSGANAMQFTVVGFY